MQTKEEQTEGTVQEAAPKRSSFSGKIGFVLAAAGSAVGLGNIWRFPYLAAKYGGGIFLLVYILLAVTFGSTVMIVEIAIGRKTGKSVIEAFKSLNRKYYFIGIVAALVPVIILPYYCVIGGWVTKYLFTFVTGGMAEAAGDGFFQSFVSGTWQPLLFFAIYLGLTFAVVIFGVEKGVERVSKILMPILVLLAVAIAIYVLTIPGAMDGVLYYITPDFSKLSVGTFLGALGQLFYSMSLAMGIMITYGSYMKKKDSIPSAVKHIELFDTGIALLAGLMIVPSAFVFYGGDMGEMQQGPTLMFNVLPKVFNTMPGGAFIGSLFFLLVLFAALTSSVSLMETIVSIISDKYGFSRRKSCLIVLGISIVLGVPSALGFGPLSMISLGGMTILDMFDFLSNSVLMPLVALGTCIFVGWIIGTKTVTDELELSAPFRHKKLLEIMVKYVAPIFLLLILISSVLGAVGVPFFAL